MNISLKSAMAGLESNVSFAGPQTKEMSPADVAELLKSLKIFEDALGNFARFKDQMEALGYANHKLESIARKEWFAKFGHKLYISPKIRLANKAYGQLLSLLEDIKREFINDREHLKAYNPK